MRPPDPNPIPPASHSAVVLLFAGSLVVDSSSPGSGLVETIPPEPNPTPSSNDAPDGVLSFASVTGAVG